MTLKRWLVISVRAPEQAVAAELAEGLISLGGTAVEEAQGMLTTYVAPPSDETRFLWEAHAHLASLLPGHDLDLIWRWEDDQDWSRKWRKGLRPRRVGRRLVLFPGHTDVQCGDGDLLIQIEPSMAFGTGEHPTTRSSLRLLELALGSGHSVLDVGTGSGILAIAAAKLGAAHVLAVDNDPDAVMNARENLERNGVAGGVELRHGVVDGPFLKLLGPESYHVVVANVLSGVLEPLLRDFAGVLPVEGRLILGGVLEEEAEGLLDSAARTGFHLQMEDLEEEWWAGLFVRRPV